METTTQAMTNEAAFEVIGSYLSRHKAEAFRALGIDAVQGRREGVRIWDLEGNSYINCRSSGGVFNFGHHPQFAVDALKAALDEHDMGDWLLPVAATRAGARRRSPRILPGDLRYTFFTPSGAEAVEVACKLARGVTGRTGIVCAEHGYHGHVGFFCSLFQRTGHTFRLAMNERGPIPTPADGQRLTRSPGPRTGRSLPVIGGNDTLTPGTATLIRAPGSLRSARDAS